MTLEQNVNKIEAIFKSYTLRGSREEILKTLALFERDVACLSQNKHNYALINWYKSRFLQETGHFSRAEQLLDEALTILEEEADQGSFEWKLRIYLSLGH